MRSGCSVVQREKGGRQQRCVPWDRQQRRRGRPRRTAEDSKFRVRRGRDPDPQRRRPAPVAVAVVEVGRRCGPGVGAQSNEGGVRSVDVDLSTAGRGGGAAAVLVQFYTRTRPEAIDHTTHHRSSRTVASVVRIANAGPHSSRTGSVQGEGKHPGRPPLHQRQRPTPTCNNTGVREPADAEVDAPLHHRRRHTRLARLKRSSVCQSWQVRRR
jgi:hypothetical protein